MRLAGACTMNRGGRPRRQVDIPELLRLRQEGWSWRRIACKMGLGKGTVCRAYEAATGAPQVSQNPKVTVDETDKTLEPVPDSEVFDLPPHLKIKLWLLRARLERERAKTQPHASVSRQHNGGASK